MNAHEEAGYYIYHAFHYPPCVGPKMVQIKRKPKIFGKPTLFSSLDIIAIIKMIHDILTMSLIKIVHSKKSLKVAVIFIEREQ